MKSFSSIVAAVAGLAIVVAACDAPSILDDGHGPSLAAAATTTNNEVVPLNLGAFVPCADGGNGEVVLFSGDLHVLMHETINDNGVTLKVQFQPQGVSGEGQTTGDKYQGTGVTQQVTHASSHGAFTQTFVNNFRLIGRGPGNNFLLHQNVHLTINANGDLTASVDNFSVECK